MRHIRFALVVLLALATARTAMAQQWPSWADEIFPDRSWRSERPYPRDTPEPWRRPQSEVIQDGGPRPHITPRAPPVAHLYAPYAPGSIVIDVSARTLYYVLQDNLAYQYRISVGRDGFDWTGTETVSRKQAWPDWHPPVEMRERDPKLPEKMTGGLRNPLGAMALYLGTSLYRIHGTNDVKSIGQAQSSGCFRMLNAEVLHLASLTEVGTTVTVVHSMPTAEQMTQLPEAPRISPKDGSRVIPPAIAQHTPDGVPPAADYHTLRQDMLKGR